MTRKFLFIFIAITILASSFGLQFTNAKAQAQVTYVTYIVQEGDTLGKIALEYCTTWNEIYNLNRDTIGTNPNVIMPGTVLIVPSYCAPSTTPPTGTVVDSGPRTRATGVYNAPYYTVAWGDTLSAIGLRFGLPWQDIAEANGITGTMIYAGQALLIPGATTTQIPPAQGPVERVYFPSGATSTSRIGIISQGAPKSYILWASAGQTITVNTVSHGEPLGISIGNTQGDLLPLTGVNSQIRNSVSATLPESRDYIVTVRPITPPESPELVFDITFIIP